MKTLNQEVRQVLNDLEETNDKIVSLFREMKQLKLEKEELEEKLKDIETDIESKVAFDEVLKNERQRNAQKNQLLKLDLDYQNLKQKLRDVEIQLIEVESEFIKQKNKFKYLNNLLRILGGIEDEA